MSELDVVKEQIAYMKVWLGILVVTDISLLGWVAANFESGRTMHVATALATIVTIAGVIIALHRRVERHIKSLRGL